MVGTQFHPEFKSRPNRAHPLFVGLIRAAKQYRDSRHHDWDEDHAVAQTESLETDETPVAAQAMADNF